MKNNTFDPINNALNTDLLDQYLMLKPCFNMTISQIAKVYGVTPSTIRRWEKKGIIRCQRNPINNYRMFTFEPLGGFKDDVSNG